jgi:hypothetical protein
VSKRKSQLITVQSIKKIRIDSLKPVKRLAVTGKMATWRIGRTDTAEALMTSMSDEIGDLPQKELAHLFMDTV